MNGVQNGKIPQDKEKAALFWAVENTGYTESSEEVSPPPSYKESAIQIEREDEGKEGEEEVDPWDLVAPPDTGKPWKGKTQRRLNYFFN